MAIWEKALKMCIRDRCWAKACHEGAIGMVNGKAKLMRDDYCDGLGDCLPACPMDAIHFIEREAEAYDEAAVLKNKEEKAKAERSRLRQWPVQIKLLPVHAPFYEGANLLIAADCTAYAYAKFHDEFLKDRVVLVGCPKLDSTDYAVKLAEICLLYTSRGGKHEQICGKSFCMDCTGDPGEDPTGRHARRQDRDW